MSNLPYLLIFLTLSVEPASCFNPSTSPSLSISDCPSPASITSYFSVECLFSSSVTPSLCIRLRCFSVHSSTCEQPHHGRAVSGVSRISCATTTTPEAAMPGGSPCVHHVTSSSGRCDAGSSSAGVAGQCPSSSGRRQTRPGHAVDGQLATEV